MHGLRNCAVSHHMITVEENFGIAQDVFTFVFCIPVTTGTKANMRVQGWRRWCPWPGVGRR